MSGGFNDPLVGGGGALVYPSVHSPNFVTGSTGWSINKNGTAEFNSLTVRNGTIISGVFLLYSSAIPAKGNLVVAFAPLAGGTDSVGNVYPQGFNFGVWNASGILSQHFGIDDNGKLYLADSTGVTRIYSDPNEALLAIYNTSGTGAGNLSTSLASSALANDGFGNAVPAGITTFGAANQVANLLGAVLQFYNQASTQAVKPNIFGSGSATTGAQLTLDSGRGGAGAVDATIELESSDTAGVAVATVAITAPVISLNSTRAQIIADGWHTVGAISQPAFGANFSSSGAPFAPVGFQYEPVNGGRVRLRGQVTLTANQLAGATIFTLPAGYQPAFKSFYTVPSTLSGGFNSGFILQVLSTGAVQIVVAGSNGNQLNLDGVTIELD